MRHLQTLLLSLTVMTPLVADAAPTLRPDVAIASDIVRIGDLVNDAGEFADIAVFRAPDLGHIGTVDARQVLDALRRHGFDDVDTRGVVEVQVTRLSRRFGPDDIERQIAAALAGQRGLSDAENLALTFDREPHALHAEPSADTLRVVSARFDPRSRRFDVTISAEGGGSAPVRQRHTGSFVETVPTAVLLRPVARGDVIRSHDVAIERRPRSNVPSGAVDNLDKLVGMAARRPIGASQPIRAADLMRPELVKQNETVTVIYETAGLSLSVRGKALETGAEGDTVNVLNVQSKRTLQGTVTGPGRVTVSAMTPQVSVGSPRTRSSALAAAQPTATE